MKSRLPGLPGCLGDGVGAGECRMSGGVISHTAPPLPRASSFPPSSFCPALLFTPRPHRTSSSPPPSSRPALLLAPRPFSRWLPRHQPSDPLAQLAAAGASVARPCRGGSGATEGQQRGPRPRGAVGAGGSRGRAGAAAALTDVRPVS